MPQSNASGSYPDPFDLVEGDLVQAAVVEAGGAGAFVVGHLLGDFQLAAVAQVFGDAGGPEAVATDWFSVTFLNEAIWSGVLIVTDQT